MGKAFDKQTKTIKDQGQEHVEAIKGNDTNEYFYENELLLSKEREIFKNIYNERLNRLEEFTKKINYDDLKFVAQSSVNETDLTQVEDLIVFSNNIRTNKIIENAEVFQEELMNT